MKIISCEKKDIALLMLEEHHEPYLDKTSHHICEKVLENPGDKVRDYCYHTGEHRANFNLE